MDEQYRRFHSGRFGTTPSDVDINFNVDIKGSKGVSSSPKKNNSNADQTSYQNDVNSGKAIPGMEGE